MLVRLILCITLLFFPFAQANKPPIQLASIYHQGIDIQAYWVSEKLDGIRAYWNGAQFISRQGHIFNAPSWFTEGFPNQPLDGELWINRAQFERVLSIVRKKKANDDEWLKVAFMIFDLPSSLLNFSERIKLMKSMLEKSPSPYLKMIKQQSIQSHTELHLLLDKVIANGGEGLMLHKGSAFYQAKRSKDLLKLKRHQDAEALVLKHLPGKGRNRGRLGALLVKNNEGIVFKIGSGFSDLERENPPAIGAIITYKYIGKTKNNVPRFASFMRIRTSF
jgi:DNA ligase-1